MKRLLGAALAVSLLTTSACAQVAKVIAPIGNHAVVASSLDDRALAEAEAGYNVVIHAYNVARAGGHVSPVLHAKVRPWIVKAHAARKLAEAAYDAGNAADLNAQLAAFKSATAEIKAFTP